MPAPTPEHNTWGPTPSPPLSFVYLWGGGSGSYLANRSFLTKDDAHERALRNAILKSHYSCHLSQITRIEINWTFENVLHSETRKEFNFNQTTGFVVL